MTGRSTHRRGVAGTLAVAAVLGAMLLGSCSGTPGPSSTGTGTAGSPGTAGSSPGTSTGSSGTPSSGTSGGSLAVALTTAAATEAYALATAENMVRALGAVPPWDNVAAAESQHLQTVRSLAGAHAVTLPGATPTGATSPTTRTAACTLGVTVEQQTVSAYDALLPKVSGYPDVSRAFTNLRDGAQSNQKAFERCAS